MSGRRRRLSLRDVQEEACGEAAEEELFFIAAGLGGVEPEAGDEHDKLLSDFLCFFEGPGVDELVPAPFFPGVFSGFQPLFIDVDESWDITVIGRELPMGGHGFGSLFCGVATSVGGGHIEDVFGGEHRNGCEGFGETTELSGAEDEVGVGWIEGEGGDLTTVGGDD